MVKRGWTGQGDPGHTDRGGDLSERSLTNQCEYSLWNGWGQILSEMTQGQLCVLAPWCCMTVGRLWMCTCRLLFGEKSWDINPPNAGLVPSGLWAKPYIPLRPWSFSTDLISLLWYTLWCFCSFVCELCKLDLIWQTEGGKLPGNVLETEKVHDTVFEIIKI